MPSFQAPAARAPAPPPEPQLQLLPGFLSPQEASRQLALLRQELAFRPDELIIAGRRVVSRRETDYRGDPQAAYAYSGALKTPAPWTPALASLRDQAAAAAGAAFNACLCNWYPSGAAGIGWHADDEPELGASPVIASLSFGQARRFRLRLKRPWRDQAGGDRVWEIPLAHGDLLIMSGLTQRFFEHHIPAEPKAQDPRLNLTFRRLFPRA